MNIKIFHTNLCTHHPYSNSMLSVGIHTIKIAV